MASKQDDLMMNRIRDVLQPMVLDGRLPEDVQTAAAATAGCGGLLDMMRGLAGVILAADDAADRSKQAATVVRSLLTEAMEDTSATTLRIGHHTVSLVDGRPSFSVTDPTQIPPSLMRQADPVPDRNAIQKLLNAGQDVPGVVRRNSAPYIQLRSNQGASA